VAGDFWVKVRFENCTDCPGSFGVTCFHCDLLVGEDGAARDFLDYGEDAGAKGDAHRMYDRASLEVLNFTILWPPEEVEIFPKLKEKPFISLLLKGSQHSSNWLHTLLFLHRYLLALQNL